MNDNNMSRKSVLDRLNMDMLDDIDIVEEEVKEITEGPGHCKIRQRKMYIKYQGFIFNFSVGGE